MSQQGPPDGGGKAKKSSGYSSNYSSYYSESQNIKKSSKSNSDLEKLIRGDRDSGYDLVKYFNPYRVNNASNDIFVKGIPYIFMTSPMLNLTKENLAADSFLAYMVGSTENKNILGNLTFTPYDFVDTSVDSVLGSNITTRSHRFMRIVTNTALSIDIKDTVARTKEVGETFYGYKQVHPGSLVDSIVGDEISIKYLEQSNLPIIKLHKAWQTYIENIRRGTFLPSKKAISDGFIDYMSSIYYILCDFDGETIKYWAKYTGVTPLNVPYSALGGELNSHEIPDITINYLYCYKEDMTMGVLRDFNRLSESTNKDNFTFEWGKGKTSDDPSTVGSNLIEEIDEKEVKNLEKPLSETIFEKDPAIWNPMIYNIGGKYKLKWTKPN